MAFLSSFISTLNAQIKAGLCEKNACLYGITQPGLLRNGKRKPVEIGPKDAREILPNDKQPIQIYHRLLSFETQPLDRPGDHYLYRITYNLRIYGVVMVGKVSEKCAAGHDGIAFEVWGAIPREATWEATGAANLQLIAGRLNNDSRAILSAEFTGLDEGKINAVTVAAFSIDYTLSGWLCGELCDLGDVVYTA